MAALSGLLLRTPIEKCFREHLIVASPELPTTSACLPQACADTSFDLRISAAGRGVYRGITGQIDASGTAGPQPIVLPIELFRWMHGPTPQQDCRGISS